ncbi:MAG: DUF4492 domain-containing protein [Bacteroidales bacterium]|nr:DUF4492 domain-containing protein [Bacteroidales bacterium]
MEKSENIFVRVFRFYRDGFRDMTWGRTLWLLVLLKLVLLFAVLRLFFFRPTMSGMTEGEKSEFVARTLLQQEEP